MRLEDMTTGHVRRAVDLYCDLAWLAEELPTKAKLRFDRSSLEGCESLDELLELFENDGTKESNRYCLRIGNSRYPFMKFVIQEYLIRGEYFFSVDTHDNLDVHPESPDWCEWELVKQYNHALKRKIETAWSEAKLPTYDDLLRLVEELARVEREDEKRRRILVVDDEANVAMGIKALLRARGYDVELAHDGGEVMERLQRDPLPDLLLLDVEMPVFDGQEVLRRMRADDRLKNVPVLLATASNLDLTKIQRISGFLRKPYPRQVLCAMIAKLLETEASGKPKAPESVPNRDDLT
ncbi:MAG: CheY-like chemotaxis protein [Planctomycetota bacterium]|jgi:CheY-like chemotaxis protein